MTIRYKYPSDEDWTIISGDDYIVEEEQGVCYTGYTVFFDVIVRDYTHTCDRDSNGNCTVGYYVTDIEDRLVTTSIQTQLYYKVTSLPFIGFPQRLPLQDTLGGTTYYTEWAGDRGIQIRGEKRDGRQKTFYYQGYPYAPNNSVRGSFFLDGSITNVRYEPRTKESPNCIIDCIFKVFLEGELVFESRKDVCPEVEIVTKSCPEDTCQVDCGNHYCCYGSDGISIFSFAK